MIQYSGKQIQHGTNLTSCKKKMRHCVSGEIVTLKYRNGTELHYKITVTEFKTVGYKPKHGSKLSKSKSRSGGSKKNISYELIKILKAA